MSWDDADYFQRRAHTERSMAAVASNPTVAAIHTRLARHYETKLFLAGADETSSCCAAQAVGAD